VAVFVSVESTDLPAAIRLELTINVTEY